MIEHVKPEDLRVFVIYDSDGEVSCVIGSSEESVLKVYGSIDEIVRAAESIVARVRSHYRPAYQVGDVVSWRDDDGIERTGTLRAVHGTLAHVMIGRDGQKVPGQSKVAEVDAGVPNTSMYVLVNSLYRR